MSTTMAKVIQSEGIVADDDDCFSGLRRLAGNVDRGVQEVQSRIETWNENGIDNCNNLDETPALLFLQQAHKDTKDIITGAKRIGKDFKMRSSTMNSVSELFVSALDSLRERLETVETFIEKYGYKRPVPDTPPQSNSESDDLFVECDDDEIEIGVVNGDNSNGDEKMRKLSDPHTPRLEDIGLSEHTLFNLKAGSFNTEGDEKKELLHKDTAAKKNTNTLLCQKNYEPEILTPKLEMYGMSEHTLMFLDVGRKTSEKENMSVNDSSSNFRLKSVPHLGRRVNNEIHTTPVKTQIMENSRNMCGPVSSPSLVKSKRVSPTFPDFESSSRQRNHHDVSDSQKFAKVDPDSPRTPPLPELTTHFIEPPKIAKPIPVRHGYDSPKTPPLPDVQSTTLTEFDVPKGLIVKDEENHHSPSFTEKTPPFPKLSARYF